MTTCRLNCCCIEKFMNMLIYLKYVVRELINPLNYLMALAIGIIINYFQGVGLFVSAVPFIVPIIVQSLSKASVKYKNRGQALLVRLPMEKKDPAFVINRTGDIIASEGLTKDFFNNHRIDNISELFEDNPELMAEIKAFSCTSEIYNAELYATKADKYYEVYIKADTFSNYLLVWLEEVTIRVKAQTECESIAMFARLNPEPVLRFDARGKILQSNSAANEIFDNKNLAGARIKTLIPELDALNFRKFINNNEQMNVTANIEDRIIRLLLRGIGEGSFCQIYGSDITELVNARKKIEEQQKELREVNENLESLVRSRTVQLTDTIAELHKTISELDKFVYSASHDLVAPMKTLSGLIHLARLESDNPSAILHFDRMKRTLDKLEDIIRLIRQYSDNSQQEVKEETIDLAVFFNRSIKRIISSSGQPVAKIENRVPAGVSLTTDPRRLSIIINNVLQNALTYRNNKKRTHSVKIDYKDSRKNYSIIKITDNGTGIKRENLDQVFGMFHRSSELSAGPGLGLYIARETVLKMKGTIEIESEENKGTAVIIKIPKKSIVEKNPAA